MTGEYQKDERTCIRCKPRVPRYSFRLCSALHICPKSYARLVSVYSQVRILRAPWSPTLFDKTAFAGIAALSTDTMHNRQNRVIASLSSLHFRSQVHNRIQRTSGLNLFIVVLICNSWNVIRHAGLRQPG